MDTAKIGSCGHTLLDGRSIRQFKFHNKLPQDPEITILMAVLILYPDKSENIKQVAEKGKFCLCMGCANKLKKTFHCHKKYKMYMAEQRNIADLFHKDGNSTAASCAKDTASHMDCTETILPPNNANHEKEILPNKEIAQDIPTFPNSQNQQCVIITIKSGSSIPIPTRSPIQTPSSKKVTLRKRMAAALRNKRQQSIITNFVRTTLHAEMKALCQSETFSDTENNLGLSTEMLKTDILKSAPTLLAAMQGMCGRNKTKFLLAFQSIIGVAMGQYNRKKILFQKRVGSILWRNRMSKKAFILLTKLGLTCSYNTMAAVFKNTSKSLEGDAIDSKETCISTKEEDKLEEKIDDHDQAENKKQLKKDENMPESRQSSPRVKKRRKNNNNNNSAE